jgi:endonuclease YncB( thermonuclease family)
MHIAENLHRRLVMVVALTIFAVGHGNLAVSQAVGGAIVSGTGKAVDGDSVLVGAGKSVVDIRLYGIDAPEHDQKCETASGGPWDCGREAILELAKLVDGRQLSCKVMELEKFGARRPIAKCFDGPNSAADEMLRKGMAWAFRRYLEPDPAELKHFVALEEESEAKKIGVWQGKAQKPWDYRTERWNRYAALTKGCPIIGNKLGRNGKKIYHTPWSPQYRGMFERLKLRKLRKTDKSKEWLCTETDAVSKGYKRAHSRD